MRQVLVGVVLFLVGVALCVWSALSPGISWDAGGLNATPRFYLGVAWALSGASVVVWTHRGRRGKR
jgi:hypothetical protein